MEASGMVVYIARKNQEDDAVNKSICIHIKQFIVHLQLQGCKPLNIL